MWGEAWERGLAYQQEPIRYKEEGRAQFIADVQGLTVATMGERRDKLYCLELLLTSLNRAT